VHTKPLFFIMRMNKYTVTLFIRTMPSITHGDNWSVQVRAIGEVTPVTVKPSCVRTVHLACTNVLLIKSYTENLKDTHTVTHKEQDNINSIFYFIFDSHLFIHDFVPDDGPVVAGNLWILAHEFNDFCFTCTTVNITTLTVSYIILDINTVQQHWQTDRL